MNESELKTQIVDYVYKNNQDFAERFEKRNECGCLDRDVDSIKKTYEFLLDFITEYIKDEDDCLSNKRFSGVSMNEMGIDKSQNMLYFHIYIEESNVDDLNTIRHLHKISNNNKLFNLFAEYWNWLSPTKDVVAQYGTYETYVSNIHVIVIEARL